MKQFVSMKRSRILLLILFSFITGISPAWAETLTANFNSGLPEGWSIVGDLIRNSDRARSGSGVWTSSKSDNANYLVTEAVEGSLTFYARAYNKSSNAYVLVYAYSGSALGEQLYVSSNMKTSSTPSFNSYTANLGSYKGQVAIALNYAAIDDLTYTQMEAVSGPALAVKDGSTKLTSPYAYSFGLATAGTTHTFTLSNSGTAAVEGLSVSKTGNFGATLSATSIAAGGEATLTITMPEATGNSVITISSTTEGVDDFVINASGTIRDANKVYLDFSDGQIPEGWTSVPIGSYASSYGSAWAASTGYVSQSGSSSSYEWAFTSPNLNFEQDETIFFETAKYGSSSWYSPSIKVQYSIDGSEWTTIGSAFTDDTYGNWTSRSVTIPVSGVKYIRFSGWYVHLRNIYGGEEPNEPKMVVTQPATLDFGVITESTTKTFTIANTGKATLEGISVTSSNSSIFAVSGAPTSLAAGASQEVTITMAASSTGALNSAITVSATDMEDVEFTVTGVVLPDGMTVVDFEDGLPAKWNNVSNYWTFNDGIATAKSSYSQLFTPILTFKEGDIVAIKAQCTDNDANDYLQIYGSTDNGSTWTAYDKKIYGGSNGLAFNSNGWGTIVLSDIPTTVTQLKFIGYYVSIDEIAGLNYAPVLEVYKNGQGYASPATHNFGECSANADVTYSFSNYGGGTINITNVEITGEGAAAYSTNWTESVAVPFDLMISRTYDAERIGVSEAVVTVTTSEGDYVINVSGSDLGLDAPELTVSPSTDADFGKNLTEAPKAIVYSVTNTGTGTLTGTISSDNTDHFVVNASSFSLGAGESMSFEIALVYDENYGAKSATITVHPTNEGLKDILISATASTLDPEAWTEDFADGTLPKGWEATTWTVGTFSSYENKTPMALAPSGSSAGTLITPCLTAKEGDVLTWDGYFNWHDEAMTVEYSTDKSTWTKIYDAYKSQEDFGSTRYTHKEMSFTAPADGDYYLRFTSTYNNGVDNFVGFKPCAQAPVIAVFSDAEATVSVASGTSKDFGWANSAQAATYYITNSGTGTLTISDISVSDGFTAATAGDVMTIVAGEDPLALTVTMSAGEIGAKSATITLTTDGGNFEIPVKGFIYGEKNLVDFTNASQYTGWTGVNVTDGVAALSSTAIQTTQLRANAAENLYVEIKGSSAYGTKSFSYSYSSDNGANWSAATALVESTYSNVADQVFTISNIADGEAESTVLIRFTGSGLGINRIYGFTAVSTPVMALDKTDDYNFGMQTTAAEYVITVTNNGTGDLENLAATLATGEDYSVVVSNTTVAPSESATITVTQKASTEYASHSDVLTISADNVNDVVINLSGKTRDAAKYFADFEDAMPTGWTATNWSRTGNSTNYYAQASYSGTNTLQTPALTIAAGEEIKYDAWVGYAGGTFKVRYTTNGGISWTEQDVEATTTQTTKTLSLNNAEPVTAYIQFVGDYYARIDNFYGGAVNDNAPLIKVTKSAAVVENGTTEAFGDILAQATATYTITNAGSGTLTITSPVATTGVATAAVSETSLDAGGSATLTITMPVEAPYGEKSGAVTVETSLGNFVINYTATTMNPNTLNVDFNSRTIPSGWYVESGWSYQYTDYLYKNYSGNTADFITQKLDVAGTDDVLKFQADKYSTSSYYTSSTVLKVSYSTDRVNWTEYQDFTSELTSSMKDFEVKGLTAGQYYLKFTGRNAEVDNIIGWTKVAGIAHDLYVTSTSFPATTTKGSDATISATVTSLIAAETDVYAKLFIDGAEEQTADAQDIALNGTKTFSFTYAIPENKTAQIKVYYSDDTEAFVTAESTMKVNYTFDETENPGAITAGTFEINMDRSFVEGWNTVCLPFEVAVTDIHENAKALAFTAYNSTEKELTFSPVSTLEAGKPYVIYVPEAISDALVFSGKAIAAITAGSSEFNGVAFQGTYAPVTFSEIDDDQYGLTATGKIAKASASATMKGFRAYFNGVPAGARMVFLDEETTGISTVTVGDSVEGAYNLQGQKIENLKKGQLYIINGKKVVIK